MTPTIKKLVLYGLASGLGEMLVKQGTTDQELWRAQKLREAGDEALNACHAKIDHSALRRVKEKIDQVHKNGSQFDVVETLSFLLLGLFDIQLHCRSEASQIDKLVKRALWFTKLYDPKLDNEEVHAEAFKKYTAWIN